MMYLLHSETVLEPKVLLALEPQGNIIAGSGLMWLAAAAMEHVALMTAVTVKNACCSILKLEHCRKDT
jgi:hypothetical protein